MVRASRIAAGSRGGACPRPVPRPLDAGLYIRIARSAVGKVPTGIHRGVLGEAEGIVAVGRLGGGEGDRGRAVPFGDRQCTVVLRRYSSINHIVVAGEGFIPAAAG